MNISRSSFNLLFGLVISSLLFSLATSVLRDRNRKSYRLVCYWAAWSTYRQESGKFTVDNVDPTLCTHLVYAFAVLGNDTGTIDSHDVYLDLDENYGLGSYKRFNKLRKQNPELTTLIGMGGWNDGDPKQMLKYSKMAADPEKRRLFVKSVVDFLKKYDFDGLDFDWEYPGLRDKVFIPEDKENYILLLRELKAGLKSDGFLLTAAVPAGKDVIDAGYNVTEVSKNLDFLHVMTYDFHGKWENFTGHNSPLYHRPGETEYQRNLNLAFAVRYWLQRGAEKEKLVIGIPLFGKCYYLKDPKKPGYGVPIQEEFPRGPITNQTGIKAFYEVCEMHKTSKDWKVLWDSYYLAPSTYNGEEWCSYDDRRSIVEKVDFLHRMGIRNIMVWSLDLDDFQGSCYGNKFPLVSGIKSRMEQLPSHFQKARIVAALNSSVTTTAASRITTTP